MDISVSLSGFLHYHLYRQLRTCHFISRQKCIVRLVFRVVSNWMLDTAVNNFCSDDPLVLIPNPNHWLSKSKDWALFCTLPVCPPEGIYRMSDPWVGSHLTWPLELSSLGCLGLGWVGTGVGASRCMRQGIHQHPVMSLVDMTWLHMAASHSTQWAAFLLLNCLLMSLSFFFFFSSY